MSGVERINDFGDSVLSTSEEIKKVYDRDIAWMTDAVTNKRGLRVLFDGLDSTGDIWPDGFMDLYEDTMYADLEELNAPPLLRRVRGSR